MRPSWTRQKAIRDLARHPRTLALAFARHPAAPAQGIRRGRSPARQMIFDIVGDLLETDANSSSSFLTTGSSVCSARCRYMAA